MNINRNVISFLSPVGFFGILVMVFMGCSGGGGDSGVAGDRPALLNGVFVDSPVEGLYYETDTQSGFTDANGMFAYMEGETISFSIGDVMLGQAPARGFMTPIHLVEGAVDETHPAVTNMARLMQTLDVDGNPDNGITITPEIEDEMMGRQLDFNLDTFAFQNHPDVVGLMARLNEMEVFSDGPHMLVPEDDARNHMRQHIDAAGNDDNMNRDGIDMGGDGINMGGDGINMGGDGINMGGDGINMGGDGINMGGDGINMGGEENVPGTHGEDSPQRQPGMNT